MSDDKPETKEVDRMERARSVTGLILVILVSLGVVVSLVGGWVRNTVLDTDSFIEVVEPLLASEEVITVLGDAVAEQVVIAVDLEARVETRLSAIDAYLSETLVDALDLPSATKALLARSDLPRLSNLAGPIADPIEEQIHQSVHGLVSSDGFQEGLPNVVAYAHRGAVALIRQDEAELEHVSIVDGEVRWDITPTIETAISHSINEGVLAGLLDSIQLPGATYEGRQEDAIAKLGDALGTVLPEDFGQITVMSEERLENWQSIARLLDRVALLAIVVTVALAGVGLWIARDKRRRLVQLAAGTVIALLVAAIVQRNVLAALDEAIPGPPEQAAAEVMFDAVLGNLRVVSWVFIAVAVAVGLSAHVAGQPRWLKALRSSDSKGPLDRLDVAMAEHRDAFAVGGFSVALLVWWWLGVSLGSVLFIGAALGGYLWYLSRAATGDELPESV